MKRRVWFPSVLSLVLISTLSACSLECLFVHTIILEYPGDPEVWPDPDSVAYTFFWKDETGTERTAISGQGEILTIRVRRGDFQAILAIPSRNGADFRPAGALYPFDLTSADWEYPSSLSESLQLSFGSGYAAITALCIGQAGFDPWVYPLSKLALVREEREKDPWNLAPWKTASALIEGSFRVSMFPAATETISLPLDALWWPESPLCSVDSVEGAQKAHLPEGLHLFYSEKERLVVSIKEGKKTFQRTMLSGEGQVSGTEFE